MICSLSDYNRLRAAVAQQAAPLQHPAVASKSAPLLNRSYSSPPLGAAPTPQLPLAFAPPKPAPAPQPVLQTPAVTSPPRQTPPQPTLGGWPNIFRPVVELASAAASVASSALSSPSTSRPGTPGPRPSGGRQRSGLTPAMDVLSCESGSMTPVEPQALPNGYGDGHPHRSAPSASGVQDALAAAVSASIHESPQGSSSQSVIGGAAPQVAMPVPRVVNEVLLPGMKVINGVAVRTSASHPIK